MRPLPVTSSPIRPPPFALLCCIRFFLLHPQFPKPHCRTLEPIPNFRLLLLYDAPHCATFPRSSFERPSGRSKRNRSLFRPTENHVHSFHMLSGSASPYLLSAHHTTLRTTRIPAFIHPHPYRFHNYITDAAVILAHPYNHVRTITNIQHRPQHASHRFY